MRFPTPSLTFVRKLARHNERPWFQANKPAYELARTQAAAFAKAVHDAVAAHDTLVPGKNPLTRIYRDTRFSKNKTPYKQHWSGGLERDGRDRRGGYYWHVEPGGVRVVEGLDGAVAFAGGGFWAPAREDLARIREELAVDHEAFRELLAGTSVHRSFPDGLYPAELLKTAPKGYDKEHPAIDLLRHKAFVLLRPFSAEDVAAPDFSERIAGTFLDMRPFLDYMTHALTTDANGVPLA